MAIVIGVITVIMGAWGFFEPKGFFDDFPIRGADWVSTLGTYNEHLLRDFGSAEVGLGIASIVAGARRSHAALTAVMSGFAIFGILHLGYHVDTFALFSPVSMVSQATALTTFVVVPLFALWGLRRSRQPSDQARIAEPSGS